MVFYRKYRPQTIDDLDSKEVRDTLTAILSKDIPHAFLFTGPKGLGKTSTARIVAKVINCQKLAKGVERSAESKNEKSLSTKPFALSDSIEPCNTCEACTSITNGTNMDILEVDAASNRGIDEIRELKETIRIPPLSAKKKVYIIDEVHMLTTEAFNALLKTLEEPPDHAVFILCTTEIHKVPATILSRSFHLSFRLATPEELVRSFKRIVAGEKLNVEDAALEEIAKLSEGGFRDGAKIFEELVSFAQGEKITAEFVSKTYRITGISRQVIILLESFQKRDTSTGLKIVAELVSQGVDMKYFLQVLVQTLHAEFLRRSGVEVITIEKVTADFSDQNLFDLLKLLMQVQAEIRSAIITQLPLELAIVEWCSRSEQNHELRIMNYDGKNGKETKEENKVEIKTEIVSASDTGVSVSNLRKQAGNIAKIKALYGEPKVANGTEETKVEIRTTGLSLMQVPNDEITKEWLAEFWRSIIGEMKEHNHTLAGILRGCKIKHFDKKQLTIETAFKFHKEKLDDGKTRKTLEEVCKVLTGNPVSVVIELKGK